MKDMNNTMRFRIGLVIVLVLYCVIALAVPFHKGAGFWICFLFTVLAICAQAYVFQIAFKKGESVRSKFYGFPIAKIGLIYAVVQIVVGLILMALGTLIPTWVSLVICVVILAISAVGFIAADAVRDEVERQDVQLKKDVSMIRALQSKMNTIAGQGTDTVNAKALKDLAEEFRYSDPVSADALAEIELELSNHVDLLSQAVLDGDEESVHALIQKTEITLAERNRLCKLSK